MPAYREEGEGAMVKKVVGGVLAILAVVLFAVIPVPEGLTREGLMSISVMVFALILWICDTIPLAVAALLALALIPILGLMPLKTALAAFGNTSVFFLIATSAMTVILLKTSIPTRMINWLIGWSKGKANRFVFGIILLSTILSAIMSNTPVVMAFIGLVMPFLKTMKAEPLKSNMGRSIMMGLTCGAMIGGMATPCGTAINILAMQLLEANTGITITFLQWMVVGVPVAIIMMLAAYFFLVIMWKPEPIPEEAIVVLKEAVGENQKLTGYEVKTLVIIGAMFVLWIMSSFVPAIDITVVAIVGAAVMCLPYPKEGPMLDWREFCDAVPWNVVIVFGAVNCYAAPFTATGAAVWVANSFVSVTGGMPMLVLSLVFALFMVALNAVVPMGPAVVGLLCGPMAAMAMAGGVISPATTTFITAFASGATFILPISMVYLLTLDKGYFTWGDVAKHGIPTSIVMVLVCGLLTPFLVMAVGL